MNFGIGWRTGEEWQLLGVLKSLHNLPCKSSFTCLQGSGLHRLHSSFSPCSCTCAHTCAHTHCPLRRISGSLTGLSCLSGQLRRLDPSAEWQLSSLPPGSTFQTSSPGAAETPPYSPPHLRAGEEGTIEAMAARHPQKLLTAFQTEGREQEGRRPVPNHHTSYVWN